MINNSQENKNTNGSVFICQDRQSSFHYKKTEL